jgi:hypothetical protein
MMGTTLGGYTILIDYLSVYTVVAASSSVYALRWELHSGATPQSPPTRLYKPFDGSNPQGPHHDCLLLVCVCPTTGTSLGGYTVIADYSFVYALRRELPSGATLSSSIIHMCTPPSPSPRLYTPHDGNYPLRLYHSHRLLACVCSTTGTTLRGYTIITAYSSMYAS